MRRVLIFCGLLLLILAGSLSSAAAQEPEYQFIFRYLDSDFYRLDCGSGYCETYGIPLPLTETCPGARVIAPLPDHSGIFVQLVCYEENIVSRFIVIDTAGNVLAEYQDKIPKSEFIHTSWSDAGLQGYWSSDQKFLIVPELTAPASYDIVFFDPLVGFTDVLAVAGEFIAFSPDGTKILFETQYLFQPDAGYPPFPFSFGETAVADIESLEASHSLPVRMLLSDWQMFNYDFTGLGWYFNNDIWLADSSTGKQYLLNLDTREMALFDPPNLPVSPYHQGMEAIRTNNTIAIWDTNTGALIDEMTFDIPLDLDLSDCEHWCWLYWLNAPRTSK